MKVHRKQRSPFGSFAIATCLLAFAPNSQGKTFPFPPLNEAVAKAAAATNLQVVASRTTDPDLLLGLSFLAQPGDPVRTELAEIAVKAKPELMPVAVVLANAMDGVDEQSIEDHIRHDPDNALGYYLLGIRLYKPGSEKESLDAFRKGAACPELRLYGGVVSNVLFKALDALNLKGRDRLCASSWMATRWANFEIGNLQSQGNVLWRLAKNADAETRKEISDLMLAVAGHLIGTDYQNRVFGERVLMNAFRLKAEIAASEHSPTMNGYVGAVQALVSTRMSGTGSNKDLAQFVPGRIWRAFVVIDPKLARENLIEMKGKQPGADPAFDAAYQEWVEASKGLIDAALPDQDEIIGAYFFGQLPPRTNAPAPWAASGTYVERLIHRKPNLFNAAAANEAAMRAMSEAGRATLAISGQTDPVTAETNECINNLRLMDGSKQQWALELGKQPGDIPTWSDIEPYLRSRPKCPSGGAYTLGSMAEKPKCSIAGHVCP
jgi:hypothetical protein